MTKNKKWTKGHYELIAKTLKSSRLFLQNSEVDFLAESFVTSLEKLNPEFNHSKFLTGCGVGEEKHGCCGLPKPDIDHINGVCPWK